ncbi:MFS transporter [Streptomyces sp. NPDC020192]|uniref:MFS transporter n=1 Tax=Streptomyces sp. NPDC020192 TaxID=3365066 RepID=UPI0037A28138
MTALSTASGVKRGTIAVFATATAITVSNIYFTQPLLEWIAQGLGVSSAAAGIVATAGQVGYALGIVVIVPLADRARLRRISSVLLAITALALLAGALAPSIAVLSTATFVLSVTTVLPQLIMPTVSSMAARGQAGRALGAVGTGLTLGALLSRTVSGALAEATGTWRAGYFAAAAATALLLLVLPRYMPEQSPHGGQDRIGYLKLLASLPRLIVGHASLRLSAVLGATGFAAFSAFWATLAFHLSQKPIELGPAAAGLFGLGSVPGALAARYSGRLTDRYGPDTVNTVGLASAGNRLRRLPVRRRLRGGPRDRLQPAWLRHHQCADSQPDPDLHRARRPTRQAQHRLHLRLVRQRRDRLQHRPGAPRSTRLDSDGLGGDGLPRRRSAVPDGPFRQATPHIRGAELRRNRPVCRRRPPRRQGRLKPVAKDAGLLDNHLAGPRKHP